MSSKTYAHQIVKNAKALAETLTKHDIDLVTGGTDNHLMVADLRPHNISGKEAAILLEQAGMVLNYNTVPFDPNPPFNPSGIRLGTPGVTTRNMKEEQMKIIGSSLAKVVKKDLDPKECYRKIKQLCNEFPIPAAYTKV